MVILNQTDKRWAGTMLGQSNASVGRYGCVVTSLAMLSSWYGKYRTPKWIAENLRFTPQGLLYWKSMDGKLPMKFVYRYYRRDDVKIKSILASMDNACILEVPFGTGKHWVALVGYSRIYGYRVADPLHGDIVYLNKRYKAITGFTEVTRG